MLLVTKNNEALLGCFGIAWLYSQSEHPPHSALGFPTQPFRHTSWNWSAHTHLRLCQHSLRQWPSHHFSAAYSCSHSSSAESSPWYHEEDHCYMREPFDSTPSLHVSSNYLALWISISYNSWSPERSADTPLPSYDSSPSISERSLCTCQLSWVWVGNYPQDNASNRGPSDLHSGLPLLHPRLSGLWDV